MAKAVAKKAKQDLASVGLMEEFQQDAGRGIENADKDSFAVPFILTIQSNSPILEDEEIEGAKPGKFFNSITGEIMDEVLVIPVYFERQFLRWVDRDAGGGFKGAYTPAEIEEMIDSGEAVRSSDGLEIRPTDAEDESFGDTRQHYVLAKSEASGLWLPAIVACSSTQIKKSKNWITQIDSFRLVNGDEIVRPPSFARIYRLTTVKESNSKGSWWGLQIRPWTGENETGVIENAALYQTARQFYEQIGAGKVRAQHEDLQAADGEEGAF